MAMGAADVVPGVSGGTIAFISGIYDPLIKSISAFDITLIRLIRKEGFLSAWRAVNGSFLAVLFAGIALSIISLASAISRLLDTQPIAMWSFFLGLILASILLVGKQIRTDSWIKTLLFFSLGLVTALTISFLNPMNTSDSLLFYFFSGALAICAMILPGISGSFILVLLGSYQAILDAVNDRNLLLLGTVALGAVIGLLSFSKLLKWLFSNYKNLTLSVLVGFIAGSIPKVWPWKNSSSPTTLYLPRFDVATDEITKGILFGLLGFLLVVILEFVGEKVKKLTPP